MTPLKQRNISFQNKCACIVDIIDLEAAIIWYQKKPSCSVKSIFMHGKYPAVSIHEEKIHVHRLLMMYWERRILATNEYVHHKNENKLDANKNNLEVQGSSKHQSITNKGRKQSEIHVMRRVKSTVKTKYGRNIYENPELINSQPN